MSEIHRQRLFQESDRVPGIIIADAIVMCSVDILDSESPLHLALYTSTSRYILYFHPPTEIDEGAALYQPATLASLVRNPSLKSWKTSFDAKGLSFRQ